MPRKHKLIKPVELTQEFENTPTVVDVSTMLKPLAKRIYHTTILTGLLIGLSGCALLWPAKEVEPAPPPPEPAPIPIVVLPSAEPLLEVSKNVIVYAQNALNKLGYELGRVDGIWGPRSAKAIRNFERTNDLESARGHLSELSLYTLEKITKITRDEKAVAATSNKFPFSARVDSSVPLKGAPQLVIIERTRALLAKPNPYSEVLRNLASGTGIYVISLQEGWYEVESEDQIKGYVKAN